MNYTPQHTAVVINAYGILPNRTVLTHYSLTSTYMTKGWQTNFSLNITKHFPAWGRRVNMVEIYAQTAEGKDWEFCVDDLLVEFVGAGKPAKRAEEEVVEMHVEMDVQ
jgi:hypothetical protein